MGTTQRPEDAALVDATQRALQAGIAAAGPGAKVGDISHAIGRVLGDDGYRVNTQFGGHGVGSTMHQDPHISNDGRPGRGYKPAPRPAARPGALGDARHRRASSRTPTAGPCAAPPAAAPPTASTPSPSPRTARRS
nr:M24 family metallopeptidase [Angustibacter aerolatus]